MEAENSGIYILKIKLAKNQPIKVGALGENNFKKGYYYYIGSAQKNLESRIERHLRTKKKFHWHIDYLLDKAKIDDYFTLNGSKDYECKLFNYLYHKDQFKIMVEGFGSSDCSCISHLLYSKNDLNLKNMLEDFKKDI